MSFAIEKSSITPLIETDEHTIPSYAKFLKTRYEEQPLPSEGLLQHSTKLCRLAMIKHTADERFVKKNIAGKVNDILHLKTAVNLQDIFKEVPKNRKIILIEGAPGAGKSSLSLNICKKWSEGEMFQEFKAVILVRLRDPEVQQAKSIAQLLPYCEKSISEEVASAIMATKGEDILWVLDGWDEFPDRLKKDDSCLVRSLIYQHQKHKSYITITSRPTSSVDLHSLVSKQIEILGFTSDELKQYFHNRLGGDSESVDTLLKKIEQYPEVQSSCYLPLHAGFIADTFLMKQDLPSTQYGIFEAVVVKCISRYQLKKGENEVQSLDDLPDDLKSNFSAICKLAYKGILENKIIFAESDLPPDFKSLDLLQEVDNALPLQVGVLKTYNFLHLSVQEFLAAQRLAKKKLYEQYWLFRGLMEDDRCLPMLTFYAAKTKLNAPGIAEFVSKVGDRYKNAKNRHEQERQRGLLAFVFRCICETEDPVLCRPLVTVFNGNFFKLIQIFDCYSLGSFLSLSSRADIGGLIDLGEIKISTIQNQKWNMFIKGLLRFSKDEPASPLKMHVNDDVTSFSNMSTELEQELVRNNLLKVLELENTSVVMFKQVVEGLKHNRSLCELHLVNCRISLAGSKLLSDALLVNKTVEVLNLSSNNMSEGVKHIASVLEENSTLTELSLCNCDITSVGVTHLSRAISVNRTITTLKLSDNEICDEGAQCIADALLCNNASKLQKLFLLRCQVTANVSSHLLLAFEKRELSTLRASYSSKNLAWDYDPDIVTVVHQDERHTYYVDWKAPVSPNATNDEIITVELPSDKTLEVSGDNTLEVSVDTEGAEVLGNILSHNTDLQNIVLDTCTVHPSKASILFNALKVNKSLKLFHVKNGLMSIKNLRVLGEALQINRSLERVFIDNRIGFNISRINTKYSENISEQSSTENASTLCRFFISPIQHVTMCSQSETAFDDVPDTMICEQSDTERAILEKPRDDHFDDDFDDVRLEGSILMYFSECLRINTTLTKLRLPYGIDGAQIELEVNRKRRKKPIDSEMLEAPPISIEMLAAPRQIQELFDFKMLELLEC